MRLRSVASLVLVALIAGAIAAHADSGSAPRPARAPVARVVPAPATRPFLVAPGAVAYACAAPAPIDPRRRTPQAAPKAPAAAPPSQALLDAFAILGRPRTDQDALPPQAVTALRARGLSPVSPDSARLLRSTPSGGRAWVVPVPDAVGRLSVFACQPGGKSGPREGLAVVAIGDAASGGGGALDDLVRGRSPATVTPCAGADHSMLSISGIVPNGVPAVFLTAPDGTAVRADVKDNGYEFLLPKQRTAEQRYVVWTGGDGTPHVQPVVAFGRWTAKACASAAKLSQSMARVSPDALPGCVTPPIIGKTAAPLLRRESRARRLRRQVGQLLYVTRCWPAGPFTPGVVVTGRPAPAPPVAVLPARPAPPAVAVAPAPAPRPRPRRRCASTADPSTSPTGSLGPMAAPRPLVVLTLLAVTVAAVSVSILAWIAIATASHTRHVVDKADGVADDAALAIRRLDRTTRELDPAVRSLRRAADALSEARTTP